MNHNDLSVGRVYFWMHFKVKGKGPFPLTMLWRDRCAPRNEADARNIEVSAQDPGPERTIELTRFSTAGRAEPRMVAWMKLGWEVIEVTYWDGKTLNLETGVVQASSGQLG